MRTLETLVKDFWANESSGRRCAWGGVVALVVLGLLFPFVLRSVSPSFACEVAWFQTRQVVPQTKLPKTTLMQKAHSSDGTTWISSAVTLVSREAQYEDPWGRPWLYRAKPIEEDGHWRLLLGHWSRGISSDPTDAPKALANLANWSRLAGGKALHPYSRGPDGLDQVGEGDDVLMQPLLGGHKAWVWTAIEFLGDGRKWCWGAAGLLVWACVSWRVAWTRYGSMGREVAASAFLLALPSAGVFALCLSNAWAIGRSDLVRAWSEQLWISPAVALACTLTLGAFVGVLAWRLRSR